jgi:hypothetical protein
VKEKLNFEINSEDVIMLLMNHNDLQNGQGNLRIEVRGVTSGETKSITDVHAFGSVFQQTCKFERFDFTRDAIIWRF